MIKDPRYGKIFHQLINGEVVFMNEKYFDTQAGYFIKVDNKPLAEIRV
jgi:hypothetical protein